MEGSNECSKMPAGLDLAVPVLLFASAFFAYLKYLAPSVHVGDPAEFALASYVLGIPHPTGYPLYTWVGHLFTLLPVGDIAYRVNLMSAFFAALTVSLLYLAILQAIGSLKNDCVRPCLYRFAAIISSLALAFSVSFWAQAEIAEVYTFNSFLIVVMIVVLFKWADNGEPRYLYALFLLLGLSLGAHLSNILFFPPFLGFIYLKDKGALTKAQNIIPMLLLFLVGALQFLYIWIRASQHPSYSYSNIDSIGSWLWFISGREYQSLSFAYNVLEIPYAIISYVWLLADNFSLIGLLLGVLGAAVLSRNSKIFFLLISMFLMNLWFFVQYKTGDVAAMLVPSFLIFSIFIGLGLFQVFISAKGALAAYPRASGQGLSIHLLKPIGVIIIIALSGAFALTSYASHVEEVDQSQSLAMSYFAYKVLDAADANSTIITNWGPSTALRYFQLAHNINPDVEIAVAEEGDWLRMLEERIDKREVLLLQITEEIWDKYCPIPVLTVPNAGTIYRVEKSNLSFAVKDHPIQYPANIALAGKIELLGYNISEVLGESEQEFIISYYWKSLNKTSEDYVVYADLLDEGGNLVFQQIYAPAYSIYTSSKWREGEVIEETYRLAVPPTAAPGIYKQVLVGAWYDPESKVILNAGYEDRLPIASLRFVDRSGDVPWDR